jgi:hypothetical protein
MAPDLAKRDLLYLSDAGNGNVYVYSFPDAKLEGTLTSDLTSATKTSCSGNTRPAVCRQKRSADSAIRLARQLAKVSKL